MVEEATTAPPWTLADPAPPAWCTACTRTDSESQNGRLLLALAFISSRNLCLAHRSHPNTCLFVAQLSLLFASCLYCLSFIHNSSHMIQNRLIQALLSCQTTMDQSGSASSSARSSTMASSSFSDNPGGSRSLVWIVNVSFSLYP